MSDSPRCGIQFLGYRHVIGSLRTIADPSAAEVAESVYAALTDAATLDASPAARALHEATQGLRRHDPTNPCCGHLRSHRLLRPALSLTSRRLSA